MLTYLGHHETDAINRVLSYLILELFQTERTSKMFTGHQNKTLTERASATVLFAIRILASRTHEAHEHVKLKTIPLSKKELFRYIHSVKIRLQMMPPSTKTNWCDTYNDTIYEFSLTAKENEIIFHQY
jgi:hypothetical protein